MFFNYLPFFSTQINEQISRLKSHVNYRFINITLSDIHDLVHTNNSTWIKIIICNSSTSPLSNIAAHSRVSYSAFHFALTWTITIHTTIRGDVSIRSFPFDFLSLLWISLKRTICCCINKINRDAFTRIHHQFIPLRLFLSGTTQQYPRHRKTFVVVIFAITILKSSIKHSHCIIFASARGVVANKDNRLRDDQPPQLLPLRVSPHHHHHRSTKAASFLTLPPCSFVKYAIIFARFG